MRTYLQALESNKPKRGRKRTPDSITKRLEAIDELLEGADPAKRLDLVQERMNLAAELETMGTGVDLSALEAEFVEVAQSYAERKGISYAAFREVGVPADVLRRAGVSRSA